MTATPRIFLLDVSGYIFRAYHAIKQGMSNSKGVPTNAVFGFTAMLLKLIADKKPTHLAPVFDVSRKSFRTEFYPAYKANRPDAPDDLVPQFALVRQMVEAFGLPVIELEGFEADDLLGSLAWHLEQQGHKVTLVTSDKDLMQLVTDQVSIYDPWKQKQIGIDEVKERFGVSPDQVVDILGLAGDSVDNIPGVPGIGEKTAQSLISEFGSITKVLENIDKISGKKRKENLTNYADQARISRRLAQIATDAPLSWSLDDFRLEAPRREKILPLFAELEFTRMAKQVPFADGDDAGTGEESAPTRDGETTTTSTGPGFLHDSYVLVNDDRSWQKLCEDLKAANIVGFDTETRSLDVYQDSLLVGLSFATTENQAYYLPVDHRGLDIRQRDKTKVLDDLREFFDDPNRHWVAHNAKFDLHVLEQEGLHIAGRVDDTMVMSYVLNPARRGHGLDALSSQELNHVMIAYEEVCGKGKKQITFDEVPLDQATRYAAEDADAALRLFHLFKERLESEQLWTIYDDLDRPLVSVLKRMERNGIRLNLDFLDQLGRDFQQTLERLEEEIHELAGETFNINSPSQLGVILFEKLGLPHGRKTKTGWSTDVSVLENLSSLHELPQKVLDYRQAAKLKSTYTDALSSQARQHQGRVHGSFNQTVALTGRLSSSGPNLQNIPVRTEEGRRIREAFIAKEGCVLLAADYSQVELRILAHLSEDRLLIDAFDKDEDIHARTAAEVFGGLPGMVTPDLRRRAKAINFGIVYGQTAFGLAESLGIPQKEAKKYIDSYFSRYPQIRDYMDCYQSYAQQNHEVQTLWGRRIPLESINAKNANLRNFALRQAINAPIQGTSADIMKKAMISICDALQEQQLETRMVLQVHDELVFEVATDEVETVTELVRTRMEQAASLRVPLRVDIGVGQTWTDAH